MWVWVCRGGWFRYVARRWCCVLLSKDGGWGVFKEVVFSTYRGGIFMFSLCLQAQGAGTNQEASFVRSEAVFCSYIQRFK